MMSNSTKTNFPLVSIVIPVYNGANFIQEAIDSALNQTYRNIEVLVVDDGSNDNNETKNILMSYGDKIRCVFKSNGGVASALNKGISSMKGDYFSWLSHDDVYLPNKVETQVKFLSKCKEDTILYSGFSVINSNSDIMYYVLNNEVNNKRFILDLLCFSGIGGCTTFIPKSCFETVGFFSEKLLHVQDIDFWIRASKHFRFKYINRNLVQTRLHEKQTSNVDNVEQKLEKEEYFINVLRNEESINFNILNYYPIVHWIAKRQFYNKILEYICKCEVNERNAMGYVDKLIFYLKIRLLLTSSFMMLIMKYVRSKVFKSFYRIYTPK